MICSEPVDVSKYGVIYFGVQKNIAPPVWPWPSSGGCWVRSAKGLTPEQIPTIMNYTTLLKADIMYNTPPCWCVYMTGLVMNYLENEIGGLENMKKINAAKARCCTITWTVRISTKNPGEKPYRSMMNVTFTSPDADRQGVLRRRPRLGFRQPEGSPPGGRHACLHLQRHDAEGIDQARRLHREVPQGSPLKIGA